MSFENSGEAIFEPTEQNSGGAVEKSAAPEPKKAPSRPFWLRLVFSLMLSVVAPLTVSVFGPFEIYSSNLTEFKFSLVDFFPYMALFALMMAAVIFTVLILLRGLAFDIGCGTVLWISLMLFVQRNYLNLLLGNGALGGDVDNATVSIETILLNTAIWLIVGAGIIVGIILLRKKHTEIINAAIIISMVALFGMQAVTFGINAVTTDVFMPVLERAEKENSCLMM